jgi:hypothetical protein
MSEIPTLAPKERAERYRTLAVEALKLPLVERTRRYRELAEEAEDAAGTVFGDAGQSYRLIAQHWRSLADEGGGQA